MGYLLLFLMYAAMIMLPMTVRNGFGQMQYQDILFFLFCGVVAYVATGSVIIFAALVVKRAYVTVGVGVGVTYCLLIARNFQGVWTFFIVQILTIIITLTGAAIIFEKMELK